MKSFPCCLLLLAFLLAGSKGEDDPCGKCSRPPIRPKIMRSTQVMSRFQQRCSTSNGLYWLQKCACQNVDLTCPGDLFNRCLASGDVSDGAYFDYNCVNATKLVNFRKCMCNLSTTNTPCMLELLKCAGLR
ncbi:hypothetical protein PPYR_14597 [Photinus pyralis]|uniref:Uncharacterized protein n=1 Tax=Photinus pyralis TaxID=7054 RepID=A0A5N4A5U0_PHOPY|nr:hypothetical protein PPYR_14597 [Photinus pyralis]